MHKVLENVANYSKDRISLDDINVENYVTTDNLLQNKQGKVEAEKMPKQTSNTVTRYDENDILIANIRPYLKKIWFANCSGGSSSDVLTLKVKKGYSPKFIYYSLFRDEFFDYMMAGSKGTKMPRGDKNQILEFPIPNFDLDEQKQIAKVLSDLDAKIEVNNKINQKLEALAKTIYDYWFVQFDFPDKNGKPYKSSGGKMVYNEKLKREIPEGWDAVRLDQMTERVCVGFVGKCQPYFCSKDDGVPLIRTGNLSSDGLDMNNMIYVNYEFHNKNIKSQLTCGDILVARHGDSGLSSIYYKKEPANCLNIVVVKPNKASNFSSEFLFQTLKTDNIINQVKATSGGSVQGVVNTKSIANVKLPVPLDENILISLNKNLRIIYTKIHNNKDENQKIADLRDWLLPMLMNGQVTVGKKDEALGMVAEDNVKYSKSE
ncbi:restriction endonuclease subunit S [Mangrovimonas xylaniphaga]|uniref:restriction endonuclease subunit S n=1 Tax=Mangrovimonas xylaniphaga TaxID=1645915 RepID=UPI0006B4B866|nr:restriction endonuclease subunit S [Mangrovimonas xylaniphaga]